MIKWGSRQRGSGVVKLSRKYKLDNVDLQGKSREGTKKRALENGDKKHKNHRVEIWAGGALLSNNITRWFTKFGAKWIPPVIWAEY